MQGHAFYKLQKETGIAWVTFTSDRIIALTLKSVIKSTNTFGKSPPLLSTAQQNRITRSPTGKESQIDLDKKIVSPLREVHLKSQRFIGPQKIKSIIIPDKLTVWVSILHLKT